MLIKTEFGYCEYSFESDFVHIYNLFVYPEFRRQGRAKELLRLAIVAVRDTSYKGEIKIVAKPKENCISLVNLIKFYKEMGLGVYTYYG